MAASTSHMEELPKIFQFKVTLARLKPSVWRRVQVPATFNFWDLHITLQDLMGWSDYHLHKFDMKNPKTGFRVTIGVPFPGDEFNETIHEKVTKISDYFVAVKDSAKYEYDFGSTWEFKIVLEKILPAVPGTQYPKCTGGRTTSPPEDEPPEPESGSESGDEDSEEPVKFDPKLVKFDNSEKRWRNACYN